MASFEDPNCGYCKRLGAELATLDNVTLYTFLYPVLGEDSEIKSRNIWCAEDRAQAWNDWILDGKAPPAAECDTAAIDANLELGQKIRIEGTPTLFFADGRRVGGFIRAPQIEQTFAEVKAGNAP
jgi:thiol:disulfide interchange protein DsbC